jgi:restriction system protein
VIARKEGKKYFIQCKKFMTQEVTPHDVRDFLGAITNVNNPAEKGFFITTNGFTLMAEKAAEGNPRIELINGSRLVEYYKLAQDKLPAENATIPIPAVPPVPQPAKICPQCGGKLELRVARQGSHAGQQFWGCSNFPKCKYIENAS